MLASCSGSFLLLVWDLGKMYSCFAKKDRIFSWYDKNESWFGNACSASDLVYEGLLLKFASSQLCKCGSMKKCVASLLISDFVMNGEVEDRPTWMEDN